MAEYTTPLGATRAKYRLIADSMPKRADRGDFTAMLADVVASADSIAEAESVWPNFAPHVRRRVAVGNLIAGTILGILIFMAGFLTAALIFGAHR